MSGRSRRNVTQQPGKVALSGALAALAAARDGGTKRAATFEVRQEEAVYDVVDEEQYAQLAAKRKIEAGECFWFGWGWASRWGARAQVWGARSSNSASPTPPPHTQR